jgi:hypothetical protein
MNERIRQLVRQAGLDDADFPIENWDNVPLAKFAELIVKECADVAKWWTPETEECEYSWLIHNKIKQHFGVKE